jgi:hypothetical protein
LLILVGLTTRFALIAPSSPSWFWLSALHCVQDWWSANLQLIYAAVYAALLAFSGQDLLH